MRNSVSAGFGLVLGGLGGYLLPRSVATVPALDPPAVAAASAPTGMPGAVGIGGIFFKSPNPDAARAWYRTHLGIESGDWGGYAFRWRPEHQPGETGYTVWSAFPDTTGYFAPSAAGFMVNFRVVGLDSLVARLRRDGVTVVGEIEPHPNGRFAWIVDVDGTKVELWEPVASRDDPYLRLP